MTYGADLLAYVQRRLAEYGVASETAREDELFQYISEGRDDIVAEFAQDERASDAVKVIFTLEQDPTNSQLYNFPDDKRDPWAILVVRDTTCRGRPLTMSLNLNHDRGQYRWNSLRQLQLPDCFRPQGAIEVEAVLHGEPIDEDTTDASDTGLPSTCFYAIGKRAAVLALTVNEESDAGAAQQDYQNTLGRLIARYGNFDQTSGLAFGIGLEAAFSKQIGDGVGGDDYAYSMGNT